MIDLDLKKNLSNLINVLERLKVKTENYSVFEAIYLSCTCKLFIHYILIQV